VRYELDFYVPEDGIHHSHRRGNFISCTRLVAGTFLSIFEDEGKYKSSSAKVSSVGIELGRGGCRRKN
jgi:hypothetical protein